MKVELITKEVAFERYLNIKDIALSTAQTRGILPGYCDSAECKLFVGLAGQASKMRVGDVCIFINDLPAEQLTDFEFTSGHFFTDKICVQNVREAAVKDGKVIILTAGQAMSTIACFKYRSFPTNTVPIAA